MIFNETKPAGPCTAVPGILRYIKVPHRTGGDCDPAGSSALSTPPDGQTPEHPLRSRMLAVFPELCAPHGELRDPVGNPWSISTRWPLRDPKTVDAKGWVGGRKRILSLVPPRPEGLGAHSVPGDTLEPQLDGRGMRPCLQQTWGCYC